MYDLLFRDAKVFDGTGAPWFRADVAIKNGYIKKVGFIEKEAQAFLTIDAQGKCLAPGFIDAHSHSDIPALTTPTLDSKVYQGVTLEVIGQCGSSAAPRNMGIRPPETEKAPEESKLPHWTDLASYISCIEERGISINIAPLTGHGTIRRQVLGAERRAPDEKELSIMKGLLEDAMNQGSFGLSTGLIYVPGTFAKTDEIIALAKIAAKHGGIYVTHIRNEGNGLIEAVDEAIRIGFEACIPVLISHFKAMGKTNWGKVNKVIEMIENARLKGLDIMADQYPYIASSTGLGSYIPAYIMEEGIDAAVKKMADPKERRKLIEANPNISWSNIMVVSLRQPEDQKYLGKTIQEIGELQGISPEEACMGLLQRNGRVSIVHFGMCEEDVQTVMKTPWVMVGSDAGSRKVEAAKGLAHPRAYGTFARVLGRYARDLKVLRMEEAIRKMTSLPAMRYGIKDRGILKEGMRADMVLFDPDTIADKATFTHPHQYAVGIDWVIVNGKAVIKEGKHTGERPGMVLRRNM
jgi:N-acyl-D-amino-acid deacylase